MSQEISIHSHEQQNGKRKRFELWKDAESQRKKKPLDVVRDRVEENGSIKGDISDSKRYFSEETKSARKANESFLTKVFSDLRYRNHKKAGSRYKDIYDDMAKFLVDKDKKDKIKYQGMNEIATIDSTGLGKEIIYHRLVTSQPRFHDLYTATMQGNMKEVKSIIGTMKLNLKADKHLAQMNRDGHISFKALHTNEHDPLIPTNIIGTNKLITKDFKDFTYGWHDATNNTFVLSTSRANTLAEAQTDRQASTYAIAQKTLFRFHEGTLIAAEDINFEKTLQPNRPGQPADAPKPEKSIYHKDGYEIKLADINELGNLAREETRNSIRRNYDTSATEHLNTLEQAVETGKLELIIGQMQKIYREDLATTYLVETVQKEVHPIKEDIQAFYTENHFRALQKLSSSEILARVLKDPEFLQPIHSYTQNMENLTDNALQSGTSEQDVRAAWRQPTLQDDLLTDRADIQKICLDIHNADDIHTMRTSIQSLAKRNEVPIPATATPQEKLQLALSNITVQDHNAKVQALQDTFRAWDTHKTTENADAFKLTASHVVDLTARNDHNRACLLKSLDHDHDSSDAQRERRLMLKDPLPFSREELDHKFENLRKDIPELQEIKALKEELEKNLESIYEHPIDYAIHTTNTIDRLTPLMVTTQIRLLLNKGKTAEAEMIIDKRADAERVLKEKLQAAHDNALNKYHDLKKLDRAHKHAMKHLVWYVIMFLGANADQAGANIGQNFQQSANNVFRGAIRS